MQVGFFFLSFLILLSKNIPENSVVPSVEETLVVTQKAADTMQKRDEAVATYVNTFILLRWLSEPQTVPTPLCFKCFCGVFCEERADVLKSFLPISAQPFGTLYINYSWDLAQKTVLHFSVPHEYITNRRGKKLLRENCSNVWISANGTRICVNETKSLLHNVLVRQTRRGFFPSFLLSGTSRAADRALRQYQPYGLAHSLHPLNYHIQ